MIGGTISFEDFRAAQVLHCRASRKKVHLVLVALGVFGLVAMAAGYRFPGMVLVSGATAGFIGDWIQHGLFARRQQLKIFAQHAALRLPVGYSWDAQSIHFRNEMGQSTRPWTFYVRVRADERVFLLYQTDNMFEVVPKAWFANAEQLARFRGFQAGCVVARGGEPSQHASKPSPLTFAGKPHPLPYPSPGGRGEKSASGFQGD